MKPFSNYTVHPPPVKSSWLPAAPRFSLCCLCCRLIRLTNSLRPFLKLELRVNEVQLICLEEIHPGKTKSNASGKQINALPIMLLLISHGCLDVVIEKKKKHPSICPSPNPIFPVPGTPENHPERSFADCVVCRMTSPSGRRGAVCAFVEAVNMF